MERKKDYILYTIIAVIVLIFAFTSGETFNKTGQQAGKTIKIGYNNYVENIAVSNLWKQLLDKKGYHVQLVRSEKAPLYAGLANGSIDISMEVWLPTTDKPYYDKYKNKVERHPDWYKGTYLGLVVPQYVKNVNTIDDLKTHKNMFLRNGSPSIVGIDAGASEMKLTQQAIRQYGIGYQLIQSSESAMLSELAKAYKQKKPIVVTLWNPHWAFNRYKLKYLKDPEAVYGHKESIYYLTRQGFSKQNPQIIKWMNRFQMSDKQLGDLILKVNKDGPEAGTKKWIKDNPKLIQKWLKG